MSGQKTSETTMPCGASCGCASEAAEPPKPKKKTLSAEQKVALKDLRSLKGEAQAAILKEHMNATRKGKKALQKALGDGDGTVPELAAKTGLPSQQVLWLLAGMRKYGVVVETGTDGDYPRYQLAPNS
jgi:predicted Rossmann fold nucleotide-binding protein DprA/Smf involved in DNA uptake